MGACLLTVLGVLPGCSFWAPNVVAYNYAPADGLNQDLPDVKIRNLLVVGDAADGPAVLSATLVNLTGDAVPVKLAVGDGALDTTVEVPANGTLTLTGAGGGDPTGSATATGPDGGGDPNGGASDAAGNSATEVVAVDSLGKAAGDTVSIVVSTPQGGAVTLLTPVLLDSGPYAGFLPS